MKPSKPTERSIIADLTALLPGLSEDGTRRVQAEVNLALAGRRLPKSTQPAARTHDSSSGNKTGVRVQIHSSMPASVLAAFSSYVALRQLSLAASHLSDGTVPLPFLRTRF
jgi:hypothetical protein